MRHNDECHILVFLTIIVIRAIIAANSLHVNIIMLTEGTADSKKILFVCVLDIFGFLRVTRVLRHLTLHTFIQKYIINA